MDLYTKFLAHSTAGVRGHPNDRNAIVYGLGLHEQTWAIAKDVAEIWFAEASLAHLRKVNWNLGMIVGAVVDTHTRDAFTWPMVTKTLFGSKIELGTIEIFLERYPLALNKFSSIYDMTSFVSMDMKSLCRVLAKCAFFIEVVTFFEAEGYAELLKK